MRSVIQPGLISSSAAVTSAMRCQALHGRARKPNMPAVNTTQLMVALVVASSMVCQSPIIRIAGS